MQLTPNYGLIKPDATDLFSDFRNWYNQTLDIIDANLGGGGGGGSTTLAGLTDVNLVSPTDKQFLMYDANSLKWVNANARHDYTLTEQVIGTWLGKPLYEITIPFSGINTTANTFKAFDISGFLTAPDIVFPQKDMSYYIVNTVERLFSEVTYEAPNLYFKTPVARTNISGHIVVRYTKTTD